MPGESMRWCRGFADARIRAQQHHLALIFLQAFTASRRFHDTAVLHVGSERALRSGHVSMA